MIFLLSIIFCIISAIQSSLSQLAYCSVSFYKDTPPQVITDILTEAREFNKNNDITGILLYKDSAYFQILEGETGVLEHLIFRISKDYRHKLVTILYNEEIQQRDFSSWVCAFRAPTYTPGLIARMQKNDFGSYIDDPTQLIHRISRKAQILLTVFEEKM